MSACKTLPCSSLPFSQEKVILSRDKLPSEELCTRAMNICKGPMVKCQDLYQYANSTAITVSRLLQHQDPQQCKYTPDSLNESVVLILLYSVALLWILVTGCYFKQHDKNLLK